MSINTFSDDNRKHFDYLQSIITRMNSNSFMIKGWAITLISALLALVASTKEYSYSVIMILPITIFWSLDAYYLLQERKFRSLYTEAIKSGSTIDIYDLNCNISIVNSNPKNNYWKVFFSETLRLFYLSLMIVAFICLILTLFVKNKQLDTIKNDIHITNDTIQIKLLDKKFNSLKYCDSSKCCKKS